MTLTRGKLTILRSPLHQHVVSRLARRLAFGGLLWGASLSSVALADPSTPPAPAVPASAMVEGFAPVPGLDDEEGDGPGLKSSPPAAPALDDGAATPAISPAAAPDSIPNLAPLTVEPLHGIPSSGFGWRDDPIRHRRRFHYGGDFRAPRDTPVYAAAGGTVAFTGRRHGYGKVIDVVHEGGLMTRYAHLNAILVDKGARVEADSFIGRVGSTGRATGPHLHFEVRIEGRAVDPAEAMRVGELQRVGDPEVARQAALALRASADTAVSTLDPPRDRSRGGDKAHGKDRARRRRPIT